MKNQCWIYARESDAKNIENHQKWDPKGIPNPSKIHPQIYQKMNAKMTQKLGEDPSFSNHKRWVVAQAMKDRLGPFASLGPRAFNCEPCCTYGHGHGHFGSRHWASKTVPSVDQTLLDKFVPKTNNCSSHPYTTPSVSAIASASTLMARHGSLCSVNQSMLSAAWVQSVQSSTMCAGCARW